MAEKLAVLSMTLVRIECTKRTSRVQETRSCHTYSTRIKFTHFERWMCPYVYDSWVSSLAASKKEEAHMRRKLWEELDCEMLSHEEGQNSNEANRRKPKSDREQEGIYSKEGIRKDWDQ